MFDTSIRRTLLAAGVALAALLTPVAAASAAGLSPANPLAGQRLFSDPPNTIAGRVIAQIRHRRPRAARLLRVIAREPETKRFGGFDPRPGEAVAAYLDRAASVDPGALPLAATYRLSHEACGGVSDSSLAADAYKRWYADFARGIGARRIVVFLEIDALITAKCLSPAGLAVRVDELRYAIDALAQLPGTIVYVDAGAADAHDPGFVASVLRRIGVGRIQGFFTNSTHQDWTSREIRYGRDLVRRLGGSPHYVISTATNGRGPLIPKSRVRYGNSFHCNAPGRGLGPKPTGNVPSRYRHLDGFAWIGNPGRSAGACSKTPNPPPSGSFWVDYAISLVRNADFRIR